LCRSWKPPTRGFAAAARSQGISPAAVSKNIAGLEQALGVRLMNRTTRTEPDGRRTRLLQQARIAIGALDTAMDAVVARKMETRGTFVFPPAPPLGASSYSGVAGAAGALPGYFGRSGF
jgi:DNA-binding transcriptional LysR family regulator